MRAVIALVLLALAASLPAAPISRETLSAVLAIADAEGVPRSVARQLCIEESGDWRTGQLGDARAIGHEAGGYKSRGLYQLHDKWIGYFVWRYWRRARLFDVYNPLDNAAVALAYLADLHRRFGTWYLAACGFNWGPGNVAKGGEVPAKTVAYAHRIIEAR